MKKNWIAMLLCLAMVFGLCAAALAESGKTKQELVAEMAENLLGHTADMSDGEIREAFRQIAEEGGFKIKEEHLDRLVKICRLLEGLSEEELRERVEQIGEHFYEGFAEVPEKFISWLEDIENGAYTWEDAKSSLFSGLGKAAGALSGFFGSVADFFSDKG